MPKASQAKPGRKQRLKVYRTEAGFHDAYVAAPNMKAALKAWGARGDLFHQQAAQVVTDLALATEPLSKPGQVILRRRGAGSAMPVERRSRQPEPKTRRSPAPSRKKLDAAIDALTQFDQQANEALSQIDQQIADLHERRRALAQTQDSRRRVLNRKRDDARDAYDAALAKWSEADSS